MPFSVDHPKLGGRKPGSPNKLTTMLAEKLEQYGCDPRVIMAMIVTNNLPCGTCRGSLKTKYKLGDGQHTKECGVWDTDGICTCEQIGERTCESCYGNGWEKCSPELRGKTAAELMQYLAPKRKAIEVTGEDGGPVENVLRLIFVEAQEGKRKELGPASIERLDAKYRDPRES